ncbi:MAG: TolC family protein [Myxococcota bacterium]
MCSFEVLLLAAVLAGTPSLPTVTLDDALALALERNAELKVARAEVEVSRVSVPLAHDWEMPKLRVQFNDVQAVPTGDFRWYAGLSWRPPNPWVWRNGSDAAEAEVVEMRAALADKSWALVRELRLAWLDLSGAAGHERIAKDSLEVRHRLVALLQRRLDGGRGTQVEVNLAQLAATDARQEELRWQAAGLKSVQAISYLVGTPVLPVPAPLAAEPPGLPQLEVLEARLDKHPALEALRAKVARAKAKEKLEAAKRLPWPELQTRFRQETSVPPKNDVQVGLTVPLGVTPAPELDVARALTVRNQAQLDAELAQRRSELQILLARAESLKERWLTFEQEYRATIESHRALQARVLAEGTLDPTLLMQADRQAIELEHKRLEVQLDLARALVELDGVAGP